MRTGAHRPVRTGRLGVKDGRQGGKNWSPGRPAFTPGVKTCRGVKTGRREVKDGRRGVKAGRPGDQFLPLWRPCFTPSLLHVCEEMMLINAATQDFLYSEEPLIACRNTHRGARTHDHKVKGLALCRLS